RAMPSGGGGGPFAGASADVDPAGNFSLTLPAGTYNVVAAAAAAAGFGSPRSRNVATVEAGRTTQKDILVDDDPTEVGLSGQVLEPGGAPSVGAMVRVGASSGRFVSVVPTDEEGKFQLGGTRAG